MIEQGRAKYPVREVILHTAALGDPAAFMATYNTPSKVWSEVDRWHKARGWKGFGYHYGVMPDGRVFKGRPETTIGAHVKEANRGTLGIMMVNVRPHNGITKFSDYFTKAQKRAVKKLIADIDARANLERVTGHNQYARKECPGFRVVSSEWLSNPNWWQRLLKLLKGKRS